MTYHINYCDGHNSHDVNGTLNEAKAHAEPLFDVTRKDVRVHDKDGNTVAIRRWHDRVPVSAAEDPSVCADFGPYGHYGPLEDDPETVAEIVREDAECVGRILANLRAGKRYGHFMANVRFPMYWTNLALSDDGQYIHYSHFGSSAVKATAKDLMWLITVIFNTTPADFERKYTAYTREQELTAAETGKPLEAAA